jgi:hypothetical protein
MWWLHWDCQGSEILPILWSVSHLYQQGTISLDNPPKWGKKKPSAKNRELGQDSRSFCTRTGNPWISAVEEKGQFLPAGGTLGKGDHLLPRRAVGVLAEGRRLPWCVYIFRSIWLWTKCLAVLVFQQWVECSLARLARGSHRGYWASARSFPSVGKLSFLSRSEGVCPNSNSQALQKLLPITHLFWRLRIGIFGSNGE